MLNTLQLPIIVGSPKRMDLDVFDSSGSVARHEVHSGLPAKDTELGYFKVHEVSGGGSTSVQKKSSASRAKGGSTARKHEGGSVGNPAKTNTNTTKSTSKGGGKGGGAANIKKEVGRKKK